EVEPGGVGAQAMTQARQTLGLVAAIDDLIADALEFSQAEIAAILDDDLIASCRTQTVNRRTAEGGDNRAAHLLLAAFAQFQGNGVGCHIRTVPFVEFTKDDIHRAEVGSVGVQDQRLAGNSDRVLDTWNARITLEIARVPQSDLLDTGHHAL